MGSLNWTIMQAIEVGGIQKVGRKNQLSRKQMMGRKLEAVRQLKLNHHHQDLKRASIWRMRQFRVSVLLLEEGESTIRSLSSAIRIGERHPF